MNASERRELVHLLKARFEENPGRHAGLEWDEIQKRLEANHEKLLALHAMEKSGGEPDVVGYDSAAEGYLFVDCSVESPAGRRSLCYDAEALASRKKNKPVGSAVDLATTMGIEILTEEQYRQLQLLGDFDAKTSSWVQTPSEIRERGGALFCDKRYGAVFLYHNGAESYYAARGFRGLLIV